MRHRKGSGWESYVTMRREALLGVSTGEGVAAARGHSTKHSTGRRRRIQGQTAARSPPPTRPHGKAHRTTLLAILHQPKEGGGSTLPLGLGWGSGGTGVGRERSMHKEALGDFNQALATKGQTWGGPGQWPSQGRNGTWQNEGTEAWGVRGPCAGALVRG